MASIWKHPNSPFYAACFGVVVGQSLRQLKLTTGTADRKLARRVADELEEAAGGRRSTDQIKSFIASIQDLRTRRLVHHAFDSALRKSTGSGLENKTTGAYLQGWLARSKGEVAPATHERYASTVDALLASLGGLADQDIGKVQVADIARFRDEQSQRLARATAGLMLKIIRIAFGAAEVDGLVPRNVARLVKLPKRSKAERADVQRKRRAFSVEELRTILSHCNAEWCSIVMFGIYTGARLGDLATLTWQNVDLTAQEIRFMPRKSESREQTVVVPMADTLRAHIESLPAGDDPRQPIHPRAFAIVQKQGRVGQLSNQFQVILSNAGLAERRTHRAKEDKPKDASERRRKSDVSFHCLRHTHVSLLKNAGVSDAIARDLVGHESGEISRMYTHIDERTKRDAVNKLPTLSRPPRGRRRIAR
ncbi:MAG: tyrosine-type recombinase/integrase [Verrucomicrobia bacterium]|nr:tyrosine-type recombinase/integrase [Verrucomicrobiota bacterium]